jgi:hypothetical protein
MPTLSKDYFKEQWKDVFEYCETSPSGVVWKINGNNKVKGRSVGYQTTHGHWKCEYNNKSISLHRVIYYLHHGILDCEQVVDHIDGNASNNAICNLRLVERVINSRNKKISLNNTVGFAGVHEQHSFIANWSEGGRQKSKKFNVKNYANIDEARQAAIDFRIQKIQEMNQRGAGYTDRHIFN